QKGVSFEEATEVGDFKHGQILMVTLNNDKKLVGTLVRVDKKNTRIFLRTDPGTLPVAIASKDVKRVDKALRKNDIKPAKGGESENESIVQPEISSIIVYNGPYRSVTYISQVLSPGEKALLADLEAAERDVARLEQLLDMKTKFLEEEFALQGE